MAAKKKPDIEFKWTPQLAYAVGLLTTDGNLSKDGRHVSLRSSDKHLLKIFKKCLSINSKISETFNNGFAKKPSYKIQYSSVQFYRWLNKIGLTPAKTYTIGALKIPQNVFRDFLRGHLDGDGYIQSYTDNYNIYKGKCYTNTRIYTRFISASETHIRWLYKMIKTCIEVKGTILFKKPSYDNRVPMWEARFSKYDSLKLFKWFYYKKNLPALMRKRHIAEVLLKRIVNNKLIR